MGTWDTGLFADDTALDVREAWEEAVRRGRDPLDVTVEVLGALGEGDPVVWLALAETQWRWGRLEEAVRERVLGLVQTGEALGEWAGTPWEAERHRVVKGLVRRLSGPPRPFRPVRPPPPVAWPWPAGTLVAYQLADGRWAAFEVVGVDLDGQRASPLGRWLDSVTAAPPTLAEACAASLRAATRNPVPWSESTVARLAAEGVIPADTRPADLDAQTRVPWPVVTLQSWRRGELPRRRLVALGSTAQPRPSVHPRLALGLRWDYLEGWLTEVLGIPEEPAR